jgi:hypothetical protein
LQRRKKKLPTNDLKIVAALWPFAGFPAARQLELDDLGDIGGVIAHAFQILGDKQ